MKTIVLHAGNKTHTTQLNRVAKFLRDRGLNTLLINDQIIDNTWLSHTQKLRIKYLKFLMRLIGLILKNEMLKEYFLSQLYIKVILLQEIYISDNISPSDIRYIITASDRSFGYEQALRYYCVKYGIRHLVLPISQASSREQMKIGIENNILRLGTQKYADHFDGIKYQHKHNQQPIEVLNKDYFYYPYWMLRALADLELLQPDAFLLGSSPQTTIFCASKDHRDKLLASGKTLSKVKLIKYIDTYLAMTLDKKQTTTKYFSGTFKNNSPLIIVALPPLFEHDLMTRCSHWKIILYILKSISQFKEVNWLISLHPKMEPDIYDTVCNKYGLRISDERFYDLAQIADCGISYEGSTLVNILEDFNLPSIVCGWWGFNYSREYKNNITFVKDKSMLCTELHSMISVDSL